MAMKLSLIQRIILKLDGMVYLEHRQLPGWSGPLPFYAFYCPEHGLVEDYPHGFHRRLDCLKCFEEWRLEHEPMVKSRKG